MRKIVVTLLLTLLVAGCSKNDGLKTVGNSIRGV
ncbi:MAG: lipoprotein [Prevotella sp.]|nr:lipoprotein [Prevotella sp.]